MLKAGFFDNPAFCPFSTDRPFFGGPMIPGPLEKAVSGLT
jgi:hypothetical protein